jgi:hypothetical protein
MFEEKYPNISRWIKEYGWIEIGQQDDFESHGFTVRALDSGGMTWDAGEEAIKYRRNLDEAFQALEAGLAEWFKEEFGE